MKSPGGALASILVFVAILDSIVTQATTISSDEDARNYVDRFLSNTVNNLNQLGSNLAILTGNARNIQQAIVNTRNNANSFQQAALSSINTSLYILNSAAAAAATRSQACADTAVPRRTNIMTQTNRSIADALKELDQLQAVDAEIVLILVRLNTNTASGRVTTAQNCKRNVVITMNNFSQVVGCMQDVTNAYVNYLNTESNRINTQFNIIQTQSPAILNNIISKFNRIISDTDLAGKVEAEAILDCAGLSAQKRVDSAVSQLSNINSQVDGNLRNGINNLVNAIANTKNVLNNNLLNATRAIEGLLAQVNSYATFFTHIAPSRAAEIQRQVDQVKANSTAQLDRIRSVYSDAIKQFDLLNASLPDIYNNYRKNYTAISSVNFTSLISPNITQRLNTADLQRALNNYISQLVDAANNATAKLQARIDEYNVLIDRVNAVSNIRLNAEFVFAINVTRTIESMYLLGGVEFRYSPSTLVTQLNNSAPVLNVINNQKQIPSLFNVVNTQIGNFSITYNNTLWSVLNPTKQLIDFVLLNNPYINSANVTSAFDRIYEQAQNNIISAINNTLRNAQGANSAIANINITVILKIVEDGVRKCFTNVDQYAAIVCANKIINEFNVNITNYLTQGQQTNSYLGNLPALLQSQINKFIEDAAKAVNDLYISLRDQIQFDVNSEILKLVIERQNNIDKSINSITDLINFINNTNSRINVKYPVDLFIAPYTQLLPLLNSTFVNINVTELISLIPSFRLDRQNDIKLIVDQIINQYLPTIQSQLISIVGDLNLKFPSINISTINATCGQYAGKSNYSLCVEAQLNGFRQYVFNVNSSLNDLLQSVRQGNSSINVNIDNTVLAVLRDIYNLSVARAVEVVNNATNVLINLPKNTINSYVTGVVNQINNITINLDKLIAAVSNPIQLVIDNLKQQYPNVNLDRFNQTLQTLKDNLKTQIVLYLQNALNFVNDIKNNANNITIDIGAFELKLKNCLNSNNDINQVINLCVIPAINAINLDLKTKADILNNLLKNINGLNITIDNNIKLILNNYTVNANVVTNTAANEAKIIDFVQSIEREIALRVNLTLTSLGQIKSDLNQLRQNNTDYLTKIQPRIDEAVQPLVIAINATLSALPNVNLTRQQEYLKTLINDAKFNSNLTIVNELNKYLNNISAINEEYNRLVLDFNNRLAELAQYNLTVRCKRNQTTDEQFRICVENFNNEFKIFIDNFTNAINNLDLKAANLSGLINGNINSSITLVLNQIFNLSNAAGNDIYNRYNITGRDIIDYALDLRIYNITSILLTVVLLANNAQELDNRNTFARGYGNQTLFTSGTAIYDIVGTGRALCGQKSVDQQLAKASEQIAIATNYTFSKAPQLQQSIAALYQLSNDINQTLFYQISLLDADRLSVICPMPSNSSRLFDMYQCIVDQVNKFGVYYDVEITKIRNYTNFAYDTLRQGSEALARWRTDYILPESASIVAQLKQISENFYKECNATVEKLINYSIGVAQSHYNSYQPRIISNFTEINILADRVISRNYTGYNISSRLTAASEPVITAINAVLSSANSSLITPDIQLALQYLIQNATGQFGAVLANFTLQSQIYKQLAVALLQNRDIIQSYHNFSALYQFCYNTSKQYPLTDLVNCNNDQSYYNVFIRGNNNTLTSLLAIKADLINFDSRPNQVISNAADIIEREFSRNIYQFAFRLYRMAGLPVPPEVASQVLENRCIQGVTTNNYYCVVTT